MVCVRFSAGGAAEVKRAVDVCGTHGTTATRFVHLPEARGALTSSRLASRSAPRMGVPHRAQSPRVWPIRWTQGCALTPTRLDSRATNGRGSITYRAQPPRPSAESVSSKIHENTKKQPSHRSTVCGVPGGTRTPGLLVRSQALYPAELQAHALTTKYIIAHGARKVNAKCDN